jgi:hypothetical protein
VGGADEQQRDTGGRRGWWLVGLLAVSGAAIGAYAGYRIDPDVSELVPSLAVAGFGLGGLIGLLLLAPVGLWRAWRRRARRRTAAPERADQPDAAGLWRADEPEPEAEAAPAPVPEHPEPERAKSAEPQVTEPEPEPEAAPPPGEEPGWYPDPAQDGLRRYWDGQAWTEHVWRGRAREQPRNARNRR